MAITNTAETGTRWPRRDRFTGYLGDKDVRCPSCRYRREYLTKRQIIGTLRFMKRESGKLSDQLRRAVDAAEVSRYRIALEAEIDHATLSRFMNGKRGLSMANMDRLAEVLGLELVAKRPTRRRQKGR